MLQNVSIKRFMICCVTRKREKEELKKNAGCTSKDKRMINTSYIAIEQSSALNGSIELIGAKNAVLVIIASLLLTRGKSRLTNVPASDDVLQMIKLMQTLGAEVFFYPHEHVLEVDTSSVTKWQVGAEIMKKMRASILVMGPFLRVLARQILQCPAVV